MLTCDLKSLFYRRDHCGVCCLEVETNQAGHVDQLQVCYQCSNDHGDEA